LLVATVLGAGVAFTAYGASEVAYPEVDAPTSTDGATGVPSGPNRAGSHVRASDCIEPACKITALPPSPHAVLLTHAQWENTVRDLLRLPAGPGLSTRFPVDPAPSGEDFGRDSANLVVATRTLWRAYRDSAEALALRVVEDPVATDRILPDVARSGAAATRVRAFVADFLPRAYRRPVEDAEVEAMVALGDSAAASDTTSDPFLIRIRWILTAILQAPSFLYRMELDAADPAGERHGSEDTTHAGDRVRLGDYALAAKLSYALWGTMPDERLTAYAKANKLATDDGIAAVVEEMLADPRAGWALMDFHEQLFRVDDFAGIVRQTGVFPKFYPDLGRDAQEDVRRTIRELLIDNPGTVRDLYSSDVAYVNANLAKVYGIDPATIPGLDSSPGSFVRVKMPDHRTGIPMHVGWLAMEAHQKDPSSIQRGVFMARRVLCIALASPPPGVLNTRIEGPPGANNRGRVEATTESLGACQRCHGRVINPMGFAFEGFDAIGAFRAQDGDSAVDTTGTTELLGAFDGAGAMLGVARDTPNAHACYAAHWSAYLNGTPKVVATSKWLSPIVDESLKGAPVREIVAELVQTDAFLTVSR
jgi:Protein of unknown function (DUF1592)/Protein of unknown function (DUF1588)/Protein of unknown function (DUF1595)/Protein of unknown function (DUF1587)